MRIFFIEFQFFFFLIEFVKKEQMFTEIKEEGSIFEIWLNNNIQNLINKTPRRDL